MKRPILATWSLAATAAVFAVAALLVVSPVFGAPHQQSATVQAHRMYFPTQQEWAKLNRTHRPDGVFPAIPAAPQGSATLPTRTAQCSTIR